ncbi:MAG TPA: ABC transporter substrate-binding protein [Methylomirabilota bacterium]|jgi:putative ABC transport system substrate-binding protein|nr:ABC transporter substrate-binding protein [Methylomirabilota bacterium]
MNRRMFLAGTVGLLVAPLDAGAQQPTRVPRIGYLEPGSITSDALLFEAFRQGLRDRGWVEGQSIAIEVRAAEGRYERLPDLAAELVHAKVDVIFAVSTPGAVAAQRATRTLPIVIGRVADPVRSGLVASLARPGGNVTGWTHQGLELRAKYLDLLKEAVPGATRIGVLWNPANPIHGPSLKTIEATARALTVELHPVGVRKPEEIEGAFSTLARQRVQALTVFQDGMFLARGPQIVALAAKTRLPAMYATTELVRGGGLMGYGVNLPEMYRRGASFVDRILKGAKPADLPVEQPTVFELVINLRTAEALGLTIPPAVLARADEVIQ